MRSRLKRFFKAFIYTNVFLILGISLTHCTFSRYAYKSYETASEEKPYDVIIVPGLPYDKEKTSSIMKLRVFWAKHLYDSGFTKNIIFSGSAVYTPYIESIAMKTIGDSLGIPQQVMFAETEAEHSTENVYYSWKMAQGLGFKKIALATDPFQAAMLRSFVKKHTPGVKIIPIIFDKINADEKDLPVINPRSAYVTNFVSIKDRETFWQRIQGTMGKRIKDEKRIEARKNNKSPDTASN